MAGKFEVYEDHAGKFRFRLKARSGDVLATGQGFRTAQDARAGCARVQSECGQGPVVVEVEK